MIPFFIHTIITYINKIDINKISCTDLNRCWCKGISRSGKGGNKGKGELHFDGVLRVKNKRESEGMAEAEILVT